MFTLHLNVKFRVFGITFGTFDKFADVSLDPIKKTIGIIPYDGGTVPANAKAVFNQNGVLLQVWQG